MRRKLIFKICVLVLSFFFFSCKNQCFLKRKYNVGFFTEGGSKKEKTSRHISDANNSVNTVATKPSNIVAAKIDSDSSFLRMMNPPQRIDDISASDSIKAHRDGFELNQVSLFQEGARSSFVEKHNSESFDFKSISLISLISASLISLGLFVRKKKIKEISKWAYRNKWKTRFLIAGASVANMGSSLIIGDLLRQNNVALPNHLMEYTAAAFGLSLAMYPKKENILFDKNTYIKRKIVHFSLAAFSCIMAITSSYNQEPYTKVIKFAMSEVLPAHSTFTFSKDSHCVSAKSQLPELNIVKPIEEHKIKWWQGLTIFFIVITAMASTLAIMFLSCYIACSGQGGVATLLGVGGTALLLFFSILSITRIRQIKIDPKKPKTNTGG